jgi:hypothetical protein
MKTLEDYAKHIAKTPRPENQREGQWLMNCLEEFHPRLEETISGTTDDPYYHNDNISRFWVRIVGWWDFVPQKERS